MHPWGHKYGLSAELPSTKHPAWRPTKVSPCRSLPVLPLAPGVTPKCHSQMSADIRGGGWYKNSVGILRTYATVWKQSREATEMLTCLHSSKHRLNAAAAGLTTEYLPRVLP